MDGQEARSWVEDIAAKKTRALQSAPDLVRSLNLHVHAWPDPAHAVLELLQNADDAGPANASDSIGVQLEFASKGLIVRHNGRAFSPDNVLGISSVGGSTKSAEKHIGFMGIGFKSVFKFAGEAFIRSGSFSFSFSPENYRGDGFGWIIVPGWRERPPIRCAKPDTTIYLPY